MRAITSIVLRNLLKFGRNKMRLIFSLLMSGTLLFVFSFVTKSTAVGVDHPLNYLIAGIVIMTVFQTALNNSMSILEDISSGFMKEILVAPIARWEIAIGQVVSSTIIAAAQGLAIVIIGAFIGLPWDFRHGSLMIALMCLVGLTFSSLGLYLAALTKDSTNFQLLVTVLTMPLSFLSGAYIPTMVLPDIVKPFVYVNPLTYTTAAFRYISLRMDDLSLEALVKSGVAFPIGGFVITPWMETALVFAMGAGFFFLCVRQFSQADFSRVAVFKRGHR